MTPASCIERAGPLPVERADVLEYAADLLQYAIDLAIKRNQCAVALGK